MPEQLKFYEQIQKEIEEALKPIIEGHPELEGAAVALAYAQEIGDPPAYLVFGDLQNTTLLCRLGMQTSKLQQVISNGVLSHFEHASRIAENMPKGSDEQATDQNGKQEEET